MKDLIFSIKPFSFQEVLEYIVKNAQKKADKSFIVTINPEIIMLAGKLPEYKRVLLSSDLALADGVGVVIAGKMMGKQFKGRVTGVDLVEKVAEVVAKQPITVGFLGGKQNVAYETAECLKSKYPGLNVVFAESEWPDLEANRDDESRIKNQESRVNGENNQSSIINHQSVDILFVAFGSPKQEKWIYDNLPKINVRIAIGVGGAFDFISGHVRRAPKLIRSLGLEWLFRLILQPWRIKRQLVLPIFLVLAIKESILIRLGKGR